MSLDKMLSQKGLSFKQLQTLEGLRTLDQQYCDFLPADLLEALQKWRMGNLPMSEMEESEFQIKLGEQLNQFLSETFGISDETKKLIDVAEEHKALMAFKERFIQRGARRYRREVEGDFETHHTMLLGKIDGDSSERL